MERFIKFSKGRIYLTPNKSYPISITNFPSGSFTLRENINQFWAVDSTNDNDHLTFKVTDYHPLDS